MRFFRQLRAAAHGKPMVVRFGSRGFAMVRGGFDAAVTNDGNRRHWSAADLLSANAQLTAATRSILRSRSRYEVMNNTYGNGIVRTLANHCVGTGPRLRLTKIKREDARDVERKFREWAVEVDLAEKLRVMRRAKTVDGEGFAIFTTNPKLQAKVKLDLRLVEADQIANPFPTVVFGQDEIDGIEYDAAGNPTGYWMLTQHPGANAASVAGDGKLLPASQVLHYFQPQRPGQGRGYPETTPSLPLFAQLRRYTLAVIAAAETAAHAAGVIYTDSSALQPDDIEPMEPIDLEPRSWLTLPFGWKIGQIKSEHPPQNYDMVKRELLNEIARAFDMPYNIAAGNSSQYNYASGRLDHQTYFHSIRVEREVMARTVLDRILWTWLREAVLIEDYLPASVRAIAGAAVDAPDIPHLWHWDGWPHVDPTKEATAQKIRLESRTTNLALEWAAQGMDWQEALEQQAEEHRFCIDNGLPSPYGPATSTTTAAPGAQTDDEDDDTGEDDDEDTETSDEEAQAQAA